MSKKKRVAIYLRVSTVEQSKNDFSSLDGQESQCKSWISGKKHHDIIEVYKDAKSGKDLTRPGIKRMLSDAKAKKFDLIVVSKLDRISRSLSDFLKLVEKLDSFGVDIAVTTQDIDTSTPAGKALQRMMLVFAEFERDMIADRTREKRIETLKAGLWQGGNPPLGYDVENKKLNINKEEADTVREIFQRYLKEKSASVVVRSLNKDGFNTKVWKTRKGKIKGGAKFEKNGLLRILKSRLYLGEYEYEDEIYPGKHEAIIEKDVFDGVQKIIKENSKEPKRYSKGSTPSNLTNISFCGLCNYALTTTSTKKPSGQKYYYYKCVKKNKEGSTKHHFPKDLPVKKVDNFVAHTVTIMLKRPELLEALRKRYDTDSESKEKNLTHSIKNLKKELKKTQREITNTMTYITGNQQDPDLNEYKERLSALKLKREELNNELQFREQELNRLNNQKAAGKDLYKRILKEFIRKWEENREEERETSIKTLVDRVTSNVKKDNSGTIDVRFKAGKKIEADWKVIKKTSSDKIKVQVSDGESTKAVTVSYSQMGLS